MYSLMCFFSHVISGDSDPGLNVNSNGQRYSGILYLVFISFLFRSLSSNQNLRDTWLSTDRLSSSLALVFAAVSISDY